MSLPPQLLLLLFTQTLSTAYQTLAGTRAARRRRWWPWPAVQHVLLLPVHPHVQHGRTVRSNDPAPSAPAWRPLCRTCGASDLQRGLSHRNAVVLHLCYVAAWANVTLPACVPVATRTAVTSRLCAAISLQVMLNTHIPRLFLAPRRTPAAELDSRSGQTRSPCDGTVGHSACKAWHGGLARSGQTRSPCDGTVGHSACKAWHGGPEQDLERDCSCIWMCIFMCMYMYIYMRMWTACASCTAVCRLGRTRSVRDGFLFPSASSNTPHLASCPEE